MSAPMTGLDRGTAYQETFHCFVPNRPGEDPDDHEHDSPPPCDYGWRCNQCDARVDTIPCPDHAPTEAPGLVLVECSAEPRHYLFAYDNDGYGTGCPQCWADRLAAKYARVSLCTHGWWHRWAPTQWVIARLASSYSWVWGDGCRACMSVYRWRWSR